MTGASPQELYDEAGAVSAEGGQVLLDGPGGVAVAMTPDAAAETGRRLIEAAAQASQQPRDVSEAG